MNYPFAALVGQQKLKQALLLCVINPAIGGVLIRGEKGTAKSTAVRGLAELMPLVSKDSNAFTEATPLFDCDECGEVTEQQIPAPFINLPLGATEDRLIGSLDLDSILSERKKKLQPGLLAAAHQGILYVDEVNLLPDHLVDVLLDAAASGVNTVQREGLSLTHPSRFSLIGTMNPEEGNLRPQFLDRFGMMVEVEAPRTVQERSEVVRRRIAFDNDPTGFINSWKKEQENIQKQLLRARLLLPKVQVADGILTLISQLCTELNIISLRADIVLYKTALTLAALEGRIEVTANDIRIAADLVLGHRQRKKNSDQNKPDDDSKLDELLGNSESETPPGNTSDNAPGTDSSDFEDNQNEQQSEQPKPNEQVLAPQVIEEIPEIVVNYQTLENEKLAGDRSNAVPAARGRQIKTYQDSTATDIALVATVQQALYRDPELKEIQRDDLHQKHRIDKTANLVIFVVDASGSMAASRRMEAVKGSVLTLLTEAYQKRDQVGVIAFRGVEAELLLSPTNSTDLAEVALVNLPTGGRTPLPHALQLSLELIEKSNLRNGLRPLLVILSDGKANVPLPGGGNPWLQTLELCKELKKKQVPSLLLDTENDYIRLGKAKDMAEALGAHYLSLEELSAKSVTLSITDRINH